MLAENLELLMPLHPLVLPQATECRAARASLVAKIRRGPVASRNRLTPRSGSGASQAHQTGRVVAPHTEGRPREALRTRRDIAALICNEDGLAEHRDRLIAGGLREDIPEQFSGEAVAALRASSTAARGGQSHR